MFRRKQWFPRWNTSACDAYADQMASWCDTGDKYCDSGDSQEVHYSYFDKYTNDAVAFVVSRYAESLAHPSAPKPSHKDENAWSTPPSKKPYNITFQNVGDAVSVRASSSTLALVVFGLFVVSLVY